MMMVNGPLEIYGVVIGVKFFDVLFNIMASMGIIFLPLLIILFKSITEPYENQLENGASTSLRRVAIQLMIWVFVVMLFVVPTHTLKLKAVTYSPFCAHGATTSTFGDTGTTADKIFPTQDFSQLRLPMMMSFILTGMAGFTNAAMTAIPCSTNVQQLSDTIDTTQLTPELAKQVDRFQNECYAPAMGDFSAQNPKKGSYATTMKNYGGQSDLQWIGSHVLQQLYYGKIYPTSPVNGFPYADYKFKYDAYNRSQGADYHPRVGLSQLQSVVAR